MRNEEATEAPEPTEKRAATLGIRQVNSRETLVFLGALGVLCG